VSNKHYSFITWYSGAFTDIFDAKNKLASLMELLNDLMTITSGLLFGLACM